ncbi:MAG: transposase family protein, partial [Microcystis aeruginosa]
IDQHFSAIEDKRVERSKRHLLIEIITIVLFAFIASAETWTFIELYGKCQYKRFKKVLKLPNCIPSHDNFNLRSGYSWREVLPQVLKKKGNID